MKLYETKNDYIKLGIKGLNVRELDVITTERDFVIPILDKIMDM